MQIHSVTTAPLLALVLCMAPHTALAQPQVGPAELARARTLLELSRAELTVEQFTLLSGRLAEAERAYAALTSVARASGQAAVALAEGGSAVGAEATATGGRALLSGVGELLPLLLLLWPATAHAPGVQQETPDVRAARSKVEQRLKELAEAARQVESERKTTAAQVNTRRQKQQCSCVCYRRGIGPLPIDPTPNAAACKAECNSRGYDGYRCGKDEVRWN